MKYTAPITSRLLVEAGVSYERSDFRSGFQPANPTTNIARLDVATGWIYENSYFNNLYEGHSWSTKASAAYVTGSHSLKVGFENRSGHAIQSSPLNGGMNVRFVNDNQPRAVNVTNGPAATRQDIRFDGGAYAQEQWRVRRLTINVGGR